MGIPSASSTSALPLLLVMARLPCLATVTPAAEHTRATVVDILKVLSPSPPVPQTSRISPARVFSSSGTSVARLRNSPAKAVSSSCDSPFFAKEVRNSAFTSAGISSPVMCSTASVTCSADRSVPARSCWVNVVSMIGRVGLPG